MPQTTASDDVASYTSQLPNGSDRFLSRVVQHTLASAWQTPDDFLQHFGPVELMNALASADELRSRLLVQLANVHEKIASKKSIDSAAEDLKLALEEKVTSPEALLDCFPADDRVKYLGAPLLWKFMFEDSFHTTTKGDGAPAHDRAVRRMTFLLECALQEELLTLQQLGDGIGFERIADCLPPEELRRVVTRALEGSRRSEPLSEERLLDVIPIGKLVGYVPLDVIWTNVVIERVAAVHGYVQQEDAVKDAQGESKLGSAPKASKKSSPEPAAEGESASAEGEDAAASAAADNPRSTSKPPTVAEDEARTRAIDRLREIERLPVRHEELTTPILLSIESMYADLLQATSDEERSECIHDSFPNEGHLRTAMLALAEFLEPSIDVTRPPISDADTEALVKLVIFEERKRKEGDTMVRRPSLRPPPLPIGRSASSIPAARVSGPPAHPGGKTRGD